MHSEPVVLDVTKSHEAVEKIHLRRGEKGLTSIDATILDGSTPFDLTSCSVVFMAQDRLERYVLASGKVTDPKAGKVSYTVDANLTSIPGEIALAYFEVTDTIGNKITTPKIPIIILENVDLAGIQADEYESEISQLLKALEDGIRDANKASNDAQEAVRAANKAVDDAATAVDNANAIVDAASQAVADARTATNNANSAAASANANAEAAAEATERAVNAAVGVESATWDANEAARLANEKAQAASDAADRVDTSIERADQAADRADEATRLATDAAGEATIAVSAANAANERASKALADMQEALDEYDTIIGTERRYAPGDSPAYPPEDGWTSYPQYVAPGQWQWTDNITYYKSAEPTHSYSVAYQGVDGRDGIGAVSSSLFWLWVDGNGDLYATYSDDTNPPSFRYDFNTGNVYAVV